MAAGPLPLSVLGRKLWACPFHRFLPDPCLHQHCQEPRFSHKYLSHKWHQRSQARTALVLGHICPISSLWVPRPYFLSSRGLLHQPSLVPRFLNSFSSKTVCFGGSFLLPPYWNNANVAAWRNPNVLSYLCRLEIQHKSPGLTSRC